MRNVIKYVLVGLFLIAFSFVLGQNNSKEHDVYSIIVKGIKVEYETFGVGKPVVMIHGFGVDREVLKGCMEPVFINRVGWKRIYFDLPGMGKTPVPKGMQNTDEMYSFVKEFIKKVIQDSNYIIIGNSYGGYIARGLVHTNPTNIDGILLICPLSIADPNARSLPQYSIAYRDTIFYNTLSPQEKELIDIFLTSQTEHSWERMESEIFPSFSKRNEEFLIRLYNPDNYTIKYDLSKTIPFNKPALILTGRQDHTVGYKDTWTYLEKYTRATFAVLDMASHNLQIEQPQVFNALVNNLFDRIENFQQ